MDKSGTTPLRVLVIAGFALSCFSLLLFLWLSFGGPIPLKPQGYQVKVSFPDAVQLAEQADVRVAGVSIGKVSAKERDPKASRTLATLQLDPEYAPLKQDARAILRQKTLLGETYVELTTGSRRAPAIPEGGRLRDAQVADTVEFDELLRIFDPETREAFALWQHEQAKAAKGRGADINDAFGNLPVFTEAATSVVEVLDRRRTALKSLVRDTGTTFGALTRDEDQLRALITETATVFDTTAAERERLAEIFRIFPTFLDESKATLARLQRFSIDTNPLLIDLEPALRDLQPTLADVRRLSPHLRAFFLSLRPLIRESKTGLPALGRVLRGLTPVFEQTGPFLAQVNPILQYLEQNQYMLTDFISIGGSATNGKREAVTGSTGHVLPQIIVTGSQTLPAANRTADNRGTTYWKPGALDDPRIGEQGAWPSFDCNHVGTKARDGETVACYEQGPIEFKGMSRRFPHLEADDSSGKK